MATLNQEHHARLGHHEDMKDWKRSKPEAGKRFRNGNEKKKKKRKWRTKSL